MTETQASLRTNPQWSVWITGTGSLAQGICHSLATVMPITTKVTIVARSKEPAQALRFTAGTRANVTGRPVTFQHQLVPLDSAEAIADSISVNPPDLILNTASYQSPGENLNSPSAWTNLIRQAGLGVTLPLQVPIARCISRALSWTNAQSIFINAAYPDAVNPVLKCMELPIFAGIGNVALLAAVLQSRLNLKNQDDLRVLAHHWHLSAPDPARHARAWYRGARIPNVAELLGDLRITPKSALNALTSHITALLLRDMAAGKSIITSLPGPCGLPGGYPVRLCGPSIDLELPTGLALENAITWNQDAASAEGVKITAEGRIEFSEYTQEKLARYLPEIIDGFRVEELESVQQHFLELRANLRQISPQDYS